jgi:5-methylcytosine-specific restriction enzyme subunit McrC
MKFDTIVVREYQRVPVVAVRAVGDRSVLSEAEADAVLAACVHMKTAPVIAGYRHLQFANWCGVIQAGGVTVEVLPKIADGDDFDRNVLLRMLAVAYEFPVSRVGDASLGKQSHSLLHWLIRWFCDELFRQFHAGPLRAYVVQHAMLPAIRGRWRPDLDATRSAGRQDQLNCEFDELTIDNAWNRALKAALRVTRRLAGGREQLLRDIEMLLAWLSDVEDVPVTVAELRRLPKNRLVARYDTALRMAEWFLANESSNLQAGANKGFALLFEMNMLFQAFLGRLLLGVLPEGCTLRKEGPRYNLAHNAEGLGRFQMKPDFCVLRGAKVVAIVDAKWKRLDPEGEYGKWGVNQADVYQLHTYAVAYGCQRVALWYPYHSGLVHHESRPEYSFLLHGEALTGSSLQIDWIRLAANETGSAWRFAIVQELAAGLARLGVVPEVAPLSGMASRAVFPEVSLAHPM